MNSIDAAERRETTHTVSIIISCFNYGRFIRSAIDSALNQDYPALQVIVVDDGSTDDSRDIIQEFEDSIVFIAKENGGQASAINMGYAKSKGDYVLFLDADDILLPTAAKTICKAMEEPDVVKAHWQLAVVDADGNPTGQKRPTGRLCNGDLREVCMRIGPTNHLSAPMSGNAFRRSFLDIVLPMEEPLFRQGADTLLFELAPFLGKIRRIETPLSQYRLHGTNYHGKMSMDQKVRRQLAFYEHICGWLVGYQARQGKKIDLQQWQDNCWWLRLSRAVEELESLPGIDPLIIADCGTWEVGQIGERPRWPFMECGGKYAGAPSNSEDAIQEIQRLSSMGAEVFAIGWPAFWLLDHFPRLRTFLDESYDCILRSERVVAYSLR